MARVFCLFVHCYLSLAIGFASWVVQLLLCSLHWPSYEHSEDWTTGDGSSEVKMRQFHNGAAQHSTATGALA